MGDTTYPNDPAVGLTSTEQPQMQIAVLHTCDGLGDCPHPFAQVNVFAAYFTGHEGEVRYEMSLVLN